MPGSSEGTGGDRGTREVPARAEAWCCLHRHFSYEKLVEFSAQIAAQGDGPAATGLDYYLLPAVGGRFPFNDPSWRRTWGDVMVTMTSLFCMASRKWRPKRTASWPSLALLPSSLCVQAASHDTFLKM